MTVRSNPFAPARAARIRVRAARLKAEMQAAHNAGPAKYLTSGPERLPAGYKPPPGLEHYENYIPGAIRRAAFRANFKLRGLQTAKRRHRKTNARKGPNIDDSDLAGHYYSLIADYLLSPKEAAREAAHILIDAENIQLASAQARLRRALKKLG